MNAKISNAFRLALLQRRADGVNQYAIARQAGLHPGVLSNLLHGGRPVYYGDARIIAVGKVLHLDANSCFDLADDDTERPR